MIKLRHFVTSYFVLRTSYFRISRAAPQFGLAAGVVGVL